MRKITQKLMNKVKEKSAISLIVLVVTIIVILILSAVVFLIISDNGIIDSSKESALKTDMQSMKDNYELTYRDKLYDHLGDESKLKDSDFEFVVPEKYKPEYSASKDGVRYSGTSDNIKKIAKEMGLLVDDKVINPDLEGIYVTVTTCSAKIEVGAKNNSNIVEYIYYIKESVSSEWKSYPSSNNVYEILKLKDNTEYEVKVVAKDETGKELESEITKIKTLELLLGDLVLKENTKSGQIYNDGTWTKENIYVELVKAKLGNTTYKVEGTENIAETDVDKVLAKEGISKVIVSTTDGTNIKTKEYEVKIDKTAPNGDFDLTEVIEKEGVNKTKTTIKGESDNLSGVKEYEYYIDGARGITTVSKVNEYTSVVDGVHKFKVVIRDNAGNEKVIEKDIDIGKIADAEGNATYKLTPNTWTNTDVRLEVTFKPQYRSLYQYSEDGKTYKDVTNPYVLNIDQNKKVYVRYRNEMNTKYGTPKEIVISNIDKVKPVVDSIVSSNTNWTNKDVVLTGKATDTLSGIRWYKWYKQGESANYIDINPASKTQITKQFTVSVNGTYIFEVKDEAGNVTTNSIVVSNIDKTAPTNTSPSLVSTTNNITATFRQTDAGGSNLNNATKAYQIKKKTDSAWGSWITNSNNTNVFSNLTKNTAYEVRTKVSDVAGTETISAISEITTVEITKPTLTPDKTAWTNQDVIVKIDYPNIVGTTRQYSIGNDTTWVNVAEYTKNVTVATNNTTVYARVIDSTNQTGGNATYTVANIDKVVPLIDSVVSSNTNPINQDIVLTGKGTDPLSGIRWYKWYKQGESTNYVDINPSSKTQITKTMTASINGTYIFEVKDEAGNVTTKNIVVSNIDKVAPVLNSINVTSPVSGTYKAGQVVTFVATYSKNIQAAAPVLKIKFGSSAERIVVAGAVSNNTITYTYTVAAGDNGVLASVSYTGSVSDNAGNILTVTNKALGGNSITADTTSPVVSNIKVTSPVAGTYKAGQVVTARVTFSENVKGTAPVLKMKFGSSAERTMIAGAVAGNNNYIDYTYTIANGDNGAFTVTSYTGGTVTDILGNALTLSAPVNSGNVVVADTTSPVVSNIKVTSPVAGIYKAGQVVTARVTFSENVKGTAPVLKMKFGTGTERTMTAGAVAGNNNYINYTYTIAGGDNGIFTVTSYTAGGITDIVGNTLTLSTPSNSGNAVIADTTNPSNAAPILTSNTNTVNVTFKQTDTGSGLNASTKQYSIKKASDASWGAWISSTSDSYSFSNLTMNTSYNVKTRITDNVGNGPVESAVATISTVNIGKPVITVSTVAPTTSDITATITYSNGGNVTYQYGYDGKTWTNTANATTVLNIKNNCTIYARMIDSTNQTGGNATYTIANIDKEKPGKPVITNSSNGAWTNKDVLVTVKSSDNVAISRYEWFENGAWTTRALGTVNQIGSITYTVNRDETVRFRAVDTAGNISDEATTVVKIDKVVPVLNSINVTSPVSGTYKAGQVVTFVATYSKNIQAAAPVLKIKFGSSAERVAVAGAVSNNTITYTYTVAAGDNGALASVSYTGSVSDNAGNILTVANKALGGNVVVADTTNPTVSNIKVTSPVAGTYKAGQVVTVRVTFSENVKGTAPVLKMKFGSSAERTMTAGAGNNNYIDYTYAIAGGDNGAFTVTSYTGGTVTDILGNALTISAPSNSGNAVIADTTSPVVSNLKVTSPVAGTYKAGQSVTARVTFSENIKGTAPVLRMKFGSSAERTMTAGSVSGNNNYIDYTYTIAGGDNGAFTVTSYTSGSITDIIGNALTISAPANSGNAVVADTTSPVVSSIKLTSPVAGTYKAGQVVTARVTFSENVKGTAPVLKMKFGSSSERTMTAGAVAGNNNYIDYTYTIASGDNGTFTVASYTAGAVTDIVGNALTISSPANSGNAVIADTTNPVNTAPVLSSNTNTVNATFKQTDTGSGLKASTKQYAIKKATDASWGAWISSTSDSYSFTNLTMNTSYNVKTRITDNVGNGPIESITSTISTVNIGRPSIVISPIGITAGNITATITYSNGGNVTYQYSYDGVNWTNTSNATTKLTITNNCTVYARMIDSTNQTGGNSTYSITNIDKSAPSKPVVSLKLNSASGGGYASGSWTNQNVFHTVTSSDNVGISRYQYSHDNSNWYDIPNDWSTSYNSNKTVMTYLINFSGSWNFYIRSIDTVGNASASSNVFTICVDKVAPSTPSVTLRYNNNSGSGYGGGWTNQNIFHSVTSSDNVGISRYQYSHDTVGWSDIPSSWSLSYNSNRTLMTYLINFSGSWNFYVRAVDHLGNVSAPSNVFSLNIDKTPPSIGLSIDLDHEKTYEYVTGGDDFSGVWRISCSTGEYSDGVNSRTFYSSNDTTKSYTVTDRAGNTATRNFRVKFLYTLHNQRTGNTGGWKTNYFYGLFGNIDKVNYYTNNGTLEIQAYPTSVNQGRLGTWYTNNSIYLADYDVLFPAIWVSQQNQGSIFVALNDTRLATHNGPIYGAGGGEYFRPRVNISGYNGSYKIVIGTDGTPEKMCYMYMPSCVLYKIY